MADERIEKWTRWIDGTIKNNVLTMHLHRYAWREVAEMLQKRPDLPVSYWWEFMLDAYATTQAIAVRRQADPHPDAASLRNLVSELAADPGRLTLEWWSGIWDIQSDPYWQHEMERQWTSQFDWTGLGHLDPQLPSSDLAALTAASSGIQRFVDRHVAHAQSVAVPAEVTLQVSDLHTAIDQIGAVFSRYYGLLTASTMLELVPTIQHDWMAVFRTPWSDELPRS